MATAKYLVGVDVGGTFTDLLAYDEAEGQAILDELITFCTQPQFVYAHSWRVGDVLMSR